MKESGYTKFELDWTPTDPPDSVLAAELADWRRLLYDTGLIGYEPRSGVGFGNLSARLRNSDSFVISGTQTGHLQALGREHFAIVTAVDDLANRVVCHGPIAASSESMTHAAIYAVGRELQAVVHVHSHRLWTALRDELPTTDEAVAYGTPAMAAEFLRLYRETDFRHRRVAVMGGHQDGLISTGETIAESVLRILTYVGEPCRASALAHRVSRP